MTGFFTKWRGEQPFELLRNSVAVCQYGHLVLLCLSPSVCHSLNYTLLPATPQRSC